jgi:hypothetical protein
MADATSVRVDQDVGSSEVLSSLSLMAATMAVRPVTCL